MTGTFVSQHLAGWSASLAVRPSLKTMRHYRAPPPLRPPRDVGLLPLTQFAKAVNGGGVLGRGGPWQTYVFLCFPPQPLPC